jgi:hypothetical protein
MNEPGCGGLVRSMARLGSLFEGEIHFERSIQLRKLGARVLAPHCVVLAGKDPV